MMLPNIVRCYRDPVNLIRVELEIPGKQTPWAQDAWPTRVLGYLVFGYFRSD